MPEQVQGILNGLFAVTAFVAGFVLPEESGTIGRDQETLAEVGMIAQGNATRVQKCMSITLPY